MFSSGQYIELPKETPPQLIVVVDTEEEFDWSKPFNRDNTCISSIERIALSQSICDEFDICPCYVIDYPMASQPLAINTLKPILSDNRCEIGAHLHPWVTPPFSEELNIYNSFPGNLPESIEYAKLKQLTMKIESNYAIKPNTYKAGRYGFGPNTINILNELGYKIDLSFCPPMDFSQTSGPNYFNLKASPSWLGSKHDILEIPMSGAYVSPFKSKTAYQIYELGQQFKTAKAPAFLARLGIVDRLVLTPEGFCIDEHIKLTKYLFDCGVRTFTWSFHSPSVVCGKTPYVQNQQQLNKFLDAFRLYFQFFLEEFNGVASTPNGIKRLVEKQR